MSGKPNSRVRCCARRKRDGQPCEAPALENGRCKLHGGLSTGPKSAEGRAKVGNATRQRWLEAKSKGRNRLGDGTPRVLQSRSSGMDVLFQQAMMLGNKGASARHAILSEFLRPPSPPPMPEPLHVVLSRAIRRQQEEREREFRSWGKAKL